MCSFSRSSGGSDLNFYCAGFSWLNAHVSQVSAYTGGKILKFLSNGTEFECYICCYVFYEFLSFFDSISTSFLH